VHYTLQEYLHLRKEECFPDIERHIAQVCLKYLSYNNIRSRFFEPGWTAGTLTQKFPFLQYAATGWGHHAKELPLESIQEYALPFLLDKSVQSVAARVHDSISPQLHIQQPVLRSTGDTSGLHTTAKFGLLELTSLLLSEGLKVNQRDAGGSTPLHLAASAGHSETVKALLEHGAYVDVVDDGMNTFGSSCYKRL
jgi:hypothetical protein